MNFRRLTYMLLAATLMCGAAGIASYDVEGATVPAAASAREHGREAIHEMARKAARSDFLNGRNGRGWKATFDWLILPANFIKVIEGAYDNIPATNANNNYIYYETLHKYRHDRRRGVDLANVPPEAYTKKI